MKRDHRFLRRICLQAHEGFPRPFRTASTRRSPGTAIGPRCKSDPRDSHPCRYCRSGIRKGRSSRRAGPRRSRSTDTPSSYVLIPPHRSFPSPMDKIVREPCPRLHPARLRRPFPRPRPSIHAGSRPDTTSTLGTGWSCSLTRIRVLRSPHRASTSFPAR